MALEIREHCDLPGQAIITGYGAVEVLTLPAPFGRMIAEHHASLMEHDNRAAADMLLHGIVTHRDIMASVQARQSAPVLTFAPKDGPA